MSQNIMKSEYKIMQVRCKDCDGSGFIEVKSKEHLNKKYCINCTGKKRCYLCENVPRLGKYDYCTKCDSRGYFELVVKKDD